MTTNVATVPTVYGIETFKIYTTRSFHWSVATVPTVYGIETGDQLFNSTLDPSELQQYLPFTVLKRSH